MNHPWETEAFQGTIALLGELPEVEPPAEAASAWRLAIAAAPIPRPSFYLASLATWPNSPRFKAAAAGVAAVLVLGIIGSALQPPRPTASPSGTGAVRYGPAEIAAPAPTTQKTVNQGLMRLSPTAEQFAPNAGAPSAVQTQSQVAGREIIQTANLNLQVAKVQVAFQKAQSLAVGAGGYVSVSSFSRDASGDTASLTLMVPTKSLDTVLARLSALGTVTVESRGGNDITNQYVDTQTQLADLQAEAARYRQFLAQAKSVSDMLKIEAQLAQVTDQINTLTAELKSMSQQVTLASISLTLTVPSGTPSTIPAGGLAGALGAALLSSLRALLAMARAVLVGLAWASPFLVLGGAGYGGYRLVRKIKDQRR